MDRMSKRRKLACPGKKFAGNAHDCVRRAVAIATGRPRSKVPHFVRRSGGRWLPDLVKWSNRVGYHVLSLPWPPRTWKSAWSLPRPTRNAVVEIGRTKGGKGFHATCVRRRRCGDQAVYDFGTSISRPTLIIMFWKKRA